MFLVRRFRISLLAVVALTLIAAADTFLGATAVCAEPGQLMLIGGRHQDLPNDFRQAFFDLAGGKEARIVVIPTAVSGVRTDEPGEFLNPWRELSPRSVQLLHTRDRNTADDPEFVKSLTQATAVFITNGHADRIFNAYRGTLVHKELKNLLARGGLIGGTGTGMAVLGDVVVWHKDPGFEPAIGLLAGFLLGDDIAEAIKANPKLVGLTIGRESAVVIRGQQARVLGKGMITVHRLQEGQAEPKVDNYKSGDEFNLDELRRAVPASTSVSREQRVAQSAVLGVWKSSDRHASMGSLYQPLHGVRKREGVVTFAQQGDRLAGFAVVDHYQQIVNQKRWTDGRTQFTSVRFAENQLIFEYPIEEWQDGAAPLSVETNRQPNRGLVRVEARLAGNKLHGKWGLFTVDGAEVFRGEWEASRVEAGAK